MTIGHFQSANSTMGACDAGASAIDDLNDTTSLSAVALAGAQWNPDGGVYFFDDDTVPDDDFPVSRNGGTWIGNCSNDKYEGRWVMITGGVNDEPNPVEPAKDVWRAMDIGNGIKVVWAITDDRDIGEIQFQLRRITDQFTILTDNFLFDIDSDDQ